MTKMQIAAKQPEPQSKWSPDEISLIKSTVAKDATDAEFKLFLYRCAKEGLDPLKPGQIFFAKYGNGPGTIIVGREGFRVRAARTGKHSGTKCGPIHDESGKLIGAWAEVYRSDWKEPAREEVSLAEYNTGRGQWAKMPLTMIKKVAEVAALRMAFPDELGGLYAPEEMDQARGGAAHAAEVQAVIEAPAQDYSNDVTVTEAEDDGPGSYEIKFGKYAGKRIDAIAPEAHRDYIAYLESSAKSARKPIGGLALEYIVHARAWLGAE